MKTQSIHRANSVSITQQPPGLSLMRNCYRMKVDNQMWVDFPINRKAPLCIWELCLTFGWWTPKTRIYTKTIESERMETSRVWHNKYLFCSSLSSWWWPNTRSNLYLALTWVLFSYIIFNSGRELTENVPWIFSKSWMDDPDVRFVGCTRKVRGVRRWI